MYIYLQEHDEIGMFEHLDYTDLSRQEFLEVFAGSVSLRDDLDRHVRLMTLGERQLHLGVRSFTQHLQNPVAVVFQYRMPLLLAEAAGIPCFGHARRDAVSFSIAVLVLMLNLDWWTVDA